MISGSPFGSKSLSICFTSPLMRYQPLCYAALVITCPDLHNTRATDQLTHLCPASAPVGGEGTSMPASNPSNSIIPMSLPHQLAVILGPFPSTLFLSSRIALLAILLHQVALPPPQKRTCSVSQTLLTSDSFRFSRYADLRGQ